MTTTMPDRHDLEQEFALHADAVRRLDHALCALYALCADDISAGSQPLMDLDAAQGQLRAALAWHNHHAQVALIAHDLADQTW